MTSDLTVAFVARCLILESMPAKRGCPYPQESHASPPNAVHPGLPPPLSVGQSVYDDSDEAMGPTPSTRGQEISNEGRNRPAVRRATRGRGDENGVGTVAARRLLAVVCVGLIVAWRKNELLRLHVADVDLPSGSFASFLAPRRDGSRPVAPKSPRRSPMPWFLTSRNGYPIDLISPPTWKLPPPTKFRGCFLL